MFNPLYQPKSPGRHHLPTKSLPQSIKPTKDRNIGFKIIKIYLRLYKDVNTIGYTGSLNGDYIT
jgi:hypothetical protein